MTKVVKNTAIGVKKFNPFAALVINVKLPMARRGVLLLSTLIFKVIEPIKVIVIIPLVVKTFACIV